MADDLERQLADLRELSVYELRARYEEVFGEPSHSCHRRHLVRRIAWRMQMQREGDLSERARRRAAELVCEADLRLTAPRMPTRKTGSAGADEENSLAINRGRPPLRPGTIISRRYKGQLIVVQVLEQGFQYDGKVFRSLTAVAQAASGAHWSGVHFFRLKKTEKGSA